MRLIQAAILICFCLSFVAPAVAQKADVQKQVESKTKPPHAPIQDEPTFEQQSALIVLNRLLESAAASEDAQLRIRTKTRAADLLWIYDEARARSLFEESFRELTEIWVESGGGARRTPTVVRPDAPLVQLQNEILSLCARRDPSLAEKLINSIKDEIKETKEATGQKPRDAAMATDRSELLLQAAASAAATNPDAAVRLAEASLTNGINPSILSVLFSLRQNSLSHSDALYRSTLAAARRDTANAGTSIMILASYVLPEFLTAGFVSEQAQHVSEPAGGDNRTIIEFLNFAHDVYTRRAYPVPSASASAAQPPEPNPMDYFNGQRLLPSFQRYMPEKVVTFRAALETAAAASRRNPATEAMSKFLQGGSTDELLKQADALKDSSQRDMLYFRAALSASSEGDFERALSIVAGIDKRDMRDGFSSMIRLQAASSMLDKNEIDAALRYAKDMTDVRQKGYLLSRIARTLLDRKDISRASEVLNDAEKEINRADDGAEKAQALLIIAEVKTRLDPAQGFEAMEAAVKAFNSADTSRREKDEKAGDAFSMTAIVNSIFKLEQPDFGPGFMLLARADFDRAVGLARKLTKEERAVYAQLAACRGILLKTPRR